MSRAVWVVAYDVSDPKRWRRVFGLLKSYGGPVQYSVFECELSAPQVRALQAGLEEAIDPAEDRVHLYPLCGQCGARVRVLGRGGRVDPLPNAWIVSDG